MSEKTMFQWYNRRTQTWSDLLNVRIGFDESFVLDKKTDTSNVNLRIESATKPDLKNMDWCRLFHFADGAEHVATYTDEGLPLNHNQYLISNPTITQHKSLPIWYVQLSLIEPIERTKGVYIGDLAYTNQISKTATINGTTSTFVKDRYNHLTALQRALKVTPANTDNYDTLYNPHTNISWFNRVQVLDTDFLSSVDFNDDSYSEITLYELLFKYDSTLGRTPALYFDIAYKNGYYNQYVHYYHAALLSPTLISSGTLHSSYTFSIDTGYAVSGAVTSVEVGKKYYYVDGVTVLHEFSVTKQNIAVGYYDAIQKDWICEYKTIDTVLNPARDEYKLKFLRQDGFDKADLTLTEVLDKATNISYTESLDNYATGVVSNVENLATGTTLQFPAQNLWAVPELDSSIRTTTTGHAKQWFVRTPFPIKTVKKLLKLRIATSYLLDQDGDAYQHGRFLTDLSNKVLEEQQYKASDDTIYDTTAGIWYTQGENKLHLNEYDYSDMGQPYIYYIEYEPILSTQCKLGSNEYTVPVNQNDSQVESAKYGKWLSEYLNSMGKSDIVVVKQHNSYYDIYEVGSRVIDSASNKTYVITSVAYKNLNFTYAVAYQLNENHVRRNDSIKASEAVRANKAISYDNLKSRKIVLNDNFKISTSAISNNTPKYLSDKKLILSALMPNQVASNKYPQLAGIIAKSTLTKDDDTVIDYERKFVTQIAPFVLSNQINFNLQFFDNAEAGIKKEYQQTIYQGFTNPFSNVNKQIPIIYTDPFGEVQKLNLYISNLNLNELGTYDFQSEVVNHGDDPPTWYTTEKNKVETAYSTMTALPEISDVNFATLQANSVVDVSDMQYLKDMLEKSNISYACALNSDNNMIVCSYLFLLSRLMNRTDNHTLSIRTFYSNCTADEMLSPAEFGGITSIAVTSNKIRLNFNPLIIDGTQYNPKSLAILGWITGEKDKEGRNIAHNLLIINDLSDTIKGELKAGYLDIYY